MTVSVFYIKFNPYFRDEQRSKGWLPTANRGSRKPSGGARRGGEASGEEGGEEDRHQS